MSRVRSAYRRSVGPARLALHETYWMGVRDGVVIGVVAGLLLGVILQTVLL